MDLTSLTTMWWAIALLFITVLATKITRARITNIDPQRTTGQLPPMVNGLALLGLLPTLLKKGLPPMFNYLYVNYGSVFTVSCFGVIKVTLLIGPEATTHFFQGLESEISHGNLLEFTVPMFGKAVGYGRDTATRMEQMRFHSEALRASRLRSHVSLMLQEVEDFFAKWGEEGVVDLKLEFEQLLMLISGRCLLGKEVRENMFDEVYTLFREIEKGVTLISFLFPYLPTPANRQRDRARIRLTEILSNVVESRKSSGRVEEDTLQKLIDSKYKDGRPTTVEEVAGLIIGLLFAGKHTSSHTSTWTGACLLSHPAFLRAAIEEQHQVAKKYKDGPEYNAFLEMDTLHNCIKEALRKNPATPLLVRRVHKRFTVQTKEGQQYDIPQDYIVATPTIVNNYIPYIYTDPQEYDPNRFGPERREDKVGGKFSYTSFGGGRHVCTGEAYAYMQLKVIWSHLLRNFDLELVSPFPNTDWSKFLPDPQGKLLVRYTRNGI
ncbi:obtusifoliol 14-alpha demethylase-like [Triticum dicoccoides]|uniref:obtusifoliol 14-alpha demethylase-like n=1 Tax=Triticum dicoccoides TaxID=85692 RepID=UPI00188EC184|nr:obtusifoliol 14-alpha demethylase-like [Triticum dicoccoides]